MAIKNYDSPEEFLDALLEHNSFVLTSHIRPDGDAIGSVLAMGAWLKKLGKKVMMVMSDAPPKNLAWLSKDQDLLLYNESYRQIERIVDAEAILVVDTNGKHRLGDLAKAISKSDKPTFIVDHHPNPEKWLQNRYVDTTASSTGEMLFRLFQCKPEVQLDEHISKALYTAIMTDTGSFKYNSVTPAVHLAVAEILKQGGFNPEPIHNLIFKSKTAGSIRLFGVVMQGLKMAYDDQLAYIRVTVDMLHATETTTDHTDGFVEHLLNIEGVKAAVIFTEVAKSVKMSFRSQETVHVNKWAEAFGGGGHKNASGLFMKGELDEVEEKVIAACLEHVDFNPESA